MLRDVTHRLENAPKGLYDLDITPSGHWIAVTERGPSQHLSFGGTQVRLPKDLSYPKVRAINNDLALVVDSVAPRKRDGGIISSSREMNGWIISSTGEILRNFYAGDAIQDVLVSDHFIVVSYFDESACGNPGMEGNGVVVFDSQGNYLFGYRDLFGSNIVIDDCYCTCWIEDYRVLFFPYTEFPLVSFDLAHKTQEIWETPDVLHGANAISSAGNSIYFHSPYGDEDGLWRWEVDGPKAVKVGEYKGELRGLKHGKFLAVTKSGYSVLTLE